MSNLRPELSNSERPVTLTNGTALYAIYGAVRGQDGLCHGQLHDRYGDHCAIGSFFTTSPRAVLPVSLIDEVAAVNDSVPHLSKRARKSYVVRWLRWKLSQAGMPGFKTATNPITKK